MACATGMDVERDFLSTLDRVRAWRIENKTLDLLDADGRSVARFEAQSN
jgi:heat shock protein HslJ